MTCTRSSTISIAAVLVAAVTLIGCDRSATAPASLATAGVQAAASPHPLLHLQFAKCATGPGVWEGQVTGDVIGDLRTELRELAVTGSIWHVRFDWIIEAGEPSFVGDLSGTLNLATGRVVMNGTVSEGQGEGARVHEEGQLVDPELSCFEGTIRVMTHSSSVASAAG
jgi:hypothetical protein